MPPKCGSDVALAPRTPNDGGGAGIMHSRRDARRRPTQQQPPAQPRPPIRAFGNMALATSPQLSPMIQRVKSPRLAMSPLPAPAAAARRAALQAALHGAGAVGTAAAAASDVPPAPKPLVVLGSANADLFFTVDRMPLPGETLAASSLETLPGGKGANQAAAAARLGCPTYFIGQVGSDSNADLLRSSLAGCGVKLEELRTVEGPTGTALILLQKSGQNSIVIVGGANQSGWALTESAKELLRGAGALLLQREVPEEVNLEAALLAVEAGVPVVLDAGGVEGPIAPELLSCLALLSPNETELARITGMPTDTEEQVAAAAQSLMQKSGVKAVLVKLGADGSLWLPGPGEPPVRQAAVLAPSVADTTGAGDCFTAAFGVSMVEGLEATAGLRFASAAASLCVRVKGAMNSMPEREAVDVLVAEQE